MASGRAIVHNDLFIVLALYNNSIMMGSGVCARPRRVFQSPVFEMLLPIAGRSIVDTFFGRISSDGRPITLYVYTHVTVIMAACVGLDYRWRGMYSKVKVESNTCMQIMI